MTMLQSFIRLGLSPRMPRSKKQILVRGIGLLAISCVFAAFSPKACCADAIVQRPHVTQLASHEFTRDGRFLVTKATDGEILVWDCASGKLLRELQPVREWHPGQPTRISLHGSELLTSDSDGIRVVDIETGRLLRTLVRPKNLRLCSLKFSQDGRSIIAGWRSDLIVWDAKSGKRRKQPAAKPGLDERVAELMKQFESKQEAKSAPHKPEAASDILRRLAILKESFADQDSSIADAVKSGPLMDTYFSPNGRVAVCDYLGDIGVSEEELKEEVSLWDFATGRLLHSFIKDLDGNAFRKKVSRVRFSRDEKTFLVGYGQPKLEVRSTKTGEVIRELAHPRGTISSIAIGPNGKWIATAGGDCIAIWDAANGSLLRQLSTPNVMHIGFFT